MIFGLQLVDYKLFDNIVKKIEQFRINKAQNDANYKVFRGEYLKRELLQIYHTEIQAGEWVIYYCAFIVECFSKDGRRFV